jgi:hypothetical protein
MLLKRIIDELFVDVDPRHETTSRVFLEYGVVLLTDPNSKLSFSGFWIPWLSS